MDYKCRYCSKKFNRPRKRAEHELIHVNARAAERARKRARKQVLFGEAPGRQEPATSFISKKFYVGSHKVFKTQFLGGRNTTWAKSSLAEAIEHAKEILNASTRGQEDMAHRGTAPEQDYAFVVQIVKVVRRQRVPVVVEDVL